MCSEAHFFHEMDIDVHPRWKTCRAWSLCCGILLGGGSSSITLEETCSTISHPLTLVEVVLISETVFLMILLSFDAPLGDAKCNSDRIFLCSFCLISFFAMELLPNRVIRVSMLLRKNKPDEVDGILKNF